MLKARTKPAQETRAKACDADPVAQAFYLFIQRNFSNRPNLETAPNQSELFE
jgi:hypothetical protein